MILTYLARWFAEQVAILMGADATRSCSPARARVIPGGVNSSIRAFKAVGGTPYVVERAEGPYVWDVEGNRYIDLVQSYGAVILGHAHPAITAAVADAATRGTSYGAPTPGEMAAGRGDRRARPRACERVRLMNSGTEATSTAVRLARGYTGRDRIVIFHGNFHGATDALLAAGGSGVATLGLPGTAGVPDAAVANTMVVPYNVVPELDEQVAAVLVEPVAANMGVVAPAPGFLAGLRAECDRVGALLVFDEVITGFRLGAGGAQAKYDIDADLTTLRQGDRRRPADRRGRRPARDHGDAVAARPGVPVRHAGRQPAGHRRRPRRAGRSSTGDVYIELMARTRRLAALLGEACRAAGLAVPSSRSSARSPGMYFGDGDVPTNFVEAKTHRRAGVRRVLPRAAARGRRPRARRVRGACSSALGHTDDVLDEIVEATAPRRRGDGRRARPPSERAGRRRPGAVLRSSGAAVHHDAILDVAARRDRAVRSRLRRHPRRPAQDTVIAADNGPVERHVDFVARVYSINGDPASRWCAASPTVSCS